MCIMSLYLVLCFNADVMSCFHFIGIRTITVPPYILSANIYLVLCIYIYMLQVEVGKLAFRVLDG